MVELRVVSVAVVANHRVPKKTLPIVRLLSAVVELGVIGFGLTIGDPEYVGLSRKRLHSAYAITLQSLAVSTMSLCASEQKDSRSGPCLLL